MSCCSEGHSATETETWAWDSSPCARDVAWQIATDRRQQLYEAASLIPVLYDVRPPEPDEQQNLATAVHRRTAVTRQLATFKKPVSSTAQERLNSYILSLQQLSASSDAVVRLFEVFEDYMYVHLLLEQCTGGTVYERILERQYFTEQEAVLLIRHMLQALVPLHDNHIYHGSLTPDSFRFLNDSLHAPLKLVDFGIDLKVHRWDTMEQIREGREAPNPTCPQFFETCKLVFCAPELAPPYVPQRKRRAGVSLLCDSQDLLSEKPSAGEHAEDFMESPLVGTEYNKQVEAADVWSVGAIAFTLLCGYPPFFAPSRNGILGRIHRGDVAFDPPFWSKISEEAKNFVSSCLQRSFWERMSIQEALHHPWIQHLAEDSPSGSMFTSFMLNLRRFYRTSLIEVYVANALAIHLKREDLHTFLRQCIEVDTCKMGFFTASDLKSVLQDLGHKQISEAIMVRFLRAYRHPGESYIDYVAMLDSIYLRQQRIFAEELWRRFQTVHKGSGLGGDPDGFVASGDLVKLLGDPVVQELLMKEIPECMGLDKGEVRQYLHTNLQKYCNERNSNKLDFHDLKTLLLKCIRSISAAGEAANNTTICEATVNAPIML